MKTCQQCGQELKAEKKGRRKFCSDKCAQKYWAKINNNSIDICLNCKKNNCTGTCEQIRQAIIRKEQKHGKNQNRRNA